MRVRDLVTASVAVLFLLTGCGDDHPTDSDAGLETWDRAVGTLDDEWAYGVAVAEDGSIVAVGSRGLHDNGDALIVMTDPEANQLREYVHDRSEPSVLYDVVITADSQVVAVGRQDQGEDGAAILAVKCNREGNEIWKRVFPSNGFDEAKAVVAHSDGGVVIGGTISRSRSEDRDCLAMHLDANGQIIWRQWAGDSLHQQGQDIVPLHDGSFVVVATDRQFNNYVYPFLFHVAADGAALGEWPIDRIVEPVGIAATQISDGMIIMTTIHDRGHADGGEPESDERFLFIDNDGHIAHEDTTKDNNGTNVIYDIIALSTGGALAVGSTSSRLLNASGRDVHVVHIDASHNVDATRSIGHHSFDDGYAITAYPDGGYIIAGATRSIGNGGVDIYLVRIGEHGRNNQ